MFFRRLSPLASAVLCSAIILGGTPFTAMSRQQDTNVSFDSLSAGKVVHGFRAAAVYLNDADQPLGARLRHDRTGFTLDLLQIQSVPQAFMYVNSFPTSDMGEPHTQEHLLLGKGNRGRAVASLEDMSLAGSSAFTQQWRTAYHFHTAAGPEVFYTLFERQVDALLHPDYTDEEIRREVRNFGVTDNPSDKSLRLEEKGTVYNEMVSYYTGPVTRLFRQLNADLFGAKHPLAFSAGGDPTAIREMKPEDIRKFHRENYRLGNMGMVASFPKEMTTGSILKRLDEILNRLEPEVSKQKFTSSEGLAAPQAATPGAVRVVEYPFKNEQQPGLLIFAWPAQPKIPTGELALMRLFLDSFAGDATTNLYKKFVDTKTRDEDLGATGVFNNVDDELGHPVYVGLEDVAVAHMTDAKIAEIRQKVQGELARVAAFKDGSAELAEFNGRVRSRVIETRRALSKFVNSPPGFGFRNTNSGWMTHLDQLNRTEDFRKSVTMKPELAFVEKLLAGKENFWGGYLKKWGFTATTPYAAAAKPNPELIRAEEQERAARTAAEVERLKKQYGTADAQEAIRRYKAEYDQTTAELERIEKQASSSARFVENPPLSLDDQLEFKVTKLAGGVPLVASTFDNMTSATTGLVLRLDGVAEEDLVYLSIMPALLTQVGVVKDGKPISYEEMSEMLRKEILGLNAYFSTNFRNGRAELAVRGAGNDAAESQRAVEWMKLVLTSPDWRKENLPRIRDVVDQTLSGFRNRMQGPEESWVNDPANAYWRQDNPLLLTTSSFLTRAHNVHRLRWMLKDAGAGAEREAVSDFLTKLAAARGSREELKALLAALKGEKDAAAKVPASLKAHADDFNRLPAGARALAVEAAKDLDLLLGDLPDASLAADWAYLAGQMRHDLLTPPEQALAALGRVREGLLKTGNARMFLTGSRASQQKLDAPVRELLAALKDAPAAPASYARARLVDSRLRSRDGQAAAPVFVGLVNPNNQGGVFLNSAPAATYLDTDRDKLLEFLAARLYGGGGAHSIFMKTWGAGLAYSNGLRAAPSSGRLNYYAERVPELPQTLRFVIEELKRAPRDAGLTEYAVAQVFGEFRSASPYEVRGEAMAADLADGLTPEVVARFRRKVLELRRLPNLADELYNRMGPVYARVLPGYDAKPSRAEGGVFFVIGPEKQLKLYEDYLKSVEGRDAQIFRLYPRDFWMPLKDGAGGV